MLKTSTEIQVYLPDLLWIPSLLHNQVVQVLPINNQLKTYYSYICVTHIQVHLSIIIHSVEWSEFPKMRN